MCGCSCPCKTPHSRAVVAVDVRTDSFIHSESCILHGPNSSTNINSVEIGMAGLGWMPLADLTVTGAIDRRRSPTKAKAKASPTTAMSTIGIKLEAQWKGSHNHHCISRMSLAECGVDWGAGGKDCE